MNKFAASIYKLVLLGLTTTLSVSFCAAQFTDVSEMLGNPIYTNAGSPYGNGLSFYDFNHDGWDDLTISRGAQTPLFFENQNGTYVPASFSIPNAPPQQIMMMLWADFNNDGHEDMFISKYQGPVEIWMNDGNFNFTNTAPAAGIYSGNYYHSGTSIADYNKDGCLDLYIAKYYDVWDTGPQTLGRLYSSNCNGTFTDVTIPSGVEMQTQLTFQPVFLDYNNDGWDDLYFINELDYFQNQLLRNNQDGTFTDVSDETGAGVFIDAMSGTVGDFNNDNYLDIFVSNRPGSGGNYLLVNNDGQTFSNQAPDLGFGMDYQGWGSVWLDYNNDSWQDIFVSVPNSDPNTYEGNRFYINNQGQSFTDAREFLGFGDDYSDTYTCARGDINNDGYFDLAHSSWHTTPFVLYQNQGGDNRFLSVSVEGTISNRNGIGSRIHCYANGNHYTRYTQCGANLLGQDSRKEIFGMLDFNTVDSLVIEWSRGLREVYYNVESNQHLYLIEGATLSEPFNLAYEDDLFLCEGDSILLDAGEFEEYNWNTGDTSRFLTVINPGQYSVEVENSYGFTVQSNPVEVLMAPVNEVVTQISNISCFAAADGQIELSISNAPVQSLLWNNGESDPLIDSLEIGFYSFIGIDSYGCEFIGNAEIEEPMPLSSQINSINPSCAESEDGSANLIVTGGTEPYIIDWNGQDPSALPGGSFEVSVTDDNGCVLNAEANLIAPQTLEATVLTTNVISEAELGNANISIVGGTPPYQIIWSNGVLNEIAIFDLMVGDYAVSLLDANGCAANFEFTIGSSVGIYNHETGQPMIFPNPFTNQIQLSKVAASTIDWTLYLHNGQLLDGGKGHPANTPLNLSSLNAGVYILKINALDVYTFKLIKLP